MAFWRPGASAPGLLAERPDGLADEAAASTVHLNPRHNLPLQQQRALLPIARVRFELLYALERYKTVVVVGETGSGKSTQIPQFLHEAGWTRGGRVVLCTQPRRMAATTVAARVADEMGCKLGSTVGYAVRFDQKVDQGGAKTSIKFVTDGLLLRETLYDPLLSSYSVIMLDEAHERSIYTDVLLGLLKKVRRKRPALRLIVSSATADAEAFRDFFETNAGADPSKDEATILSIVGRQHEVDVLYSVKPQLNYIQAAVDTVVTIVKNEGRGDVLVFLPGMEEIDQAVAKTKEYMSASGRENSVLVLPLYASLPHHLQMKAIGAPPRHVERKVVFATNIAETSLTIDGVRFIVDAGFVKLPIYDVRTGFESLVVTPISKASAAQRAGRAGRTGPGKCFRLYTEETFGSLRDHTIPEVQRSNLAWMALQLKALGIDQVMSFDFISQPSAEAMMRGLELLYALGAVDDRCRLTPELGEKMAEFPVEPRLSKVLLASFDFRCTEEVLSIVAMLQVQNLWGSPKGRDNREAQEEAMAELARKEGDHLTLLHIYNQFEELGGADARREWCQERFLNYRSLVRAGEIRGQLRRYIERYKPPGAVLASCCEDTQALRKCLVAGFFFNAARLKSDGRYYTVRGDHPVALHPTSVLAKYGAPPEWVVYHDVVLTTQEYLRDCLKIRPQWLMELAPHFYQFRGGVGAGGK